MLAGVGTFLLRKSDEIVAARVGTTAEYGIYNVGSDLGRLPVSQLGPAMMRAFLPVLSSIQTDIQRTNNAVLKTLSAANSITLPMGFGVAATALPLTVLILGDKWREAAPIVAVYAVVGSVQFAMSPLNTLLVLRGHTRTQSAVVWIEFTVFAVASLVLVPYLHLIGLVWARLLASTVNAFVTASSAQRYCGVRLSSVLGAFWRPLTGALGMYLLVSEVIARVPAGGMQLLAGVASGVVAYTAWLSLSWVVMKRPEGIESTVMDLLVHRANRLAGK
jgi:lipopolysaccharide exporter